MNSINELSLAIKHLSNFVGSGTATGFSYEISQCALGALRWVGTMYGVSKGSCNEVFDLFENLDEF